MNNWISNKKRVEIELTTDCNLKCFNCNRSCRQASSRESMTVGQMKKFVAESIELDWKWEYIGLIGGEPTLHPDFIKILEIVKQYKNFYPKCNVDIVTNGFSDRTKSFLIEAPNWVTVKNSQKKSSINSFSSYNIAPIDLKKCKDGNFESGCWITQTCGLGLSRYGYYACGPGASVDRVFGFNVGIKKLSKITNVKLKNQMKLLCQYCGHYKDPSILDSNRKKYFVKKEQMSPSWDEAYKKYKKEKPTLSLY